MLEEDMLVNISHLRTSATILLKDLIFVLQIFQHVYIPSSHICQM